MKIWSSKSNEILILSFNSIHLQSTLTMSFQLDMLLSLCFWKATKNWEKKNEHNTWSTESNERLFLHLLFPSLYFICFCFLPVSQFFHQFGWCLSVFSTLKARFQSKMEGWSLEWTRGKQQKGEDYDTKFKNAIRKRTPSSWVEWENPEKTTSKVIWSKEKRDAKVEFFYSYSQYLHK